MESNKDKERPLISFDWALKRLLRNKANFEVVEGFLNELLGRRIRVTNVLESESNKEHTEDKFNRVDVIVENAAGEIILIELQFILEMDYFQRMLYGTSKAIVERMVQGDEYMKIRKVYSVNIVYFDLGQGADYVYYGRTDFKGIHNSDILELSEKQREIFGQIQAGDLYPEYYVLKINNFNDVAANTLDEWIYFLKHNRILENFSAEGLLKAWDILDYSRLSPKEKVNYDYEQNTKSHYLSHIASAKASGRSEMKKEYVQAIEEKDKTIEGKDKTIEEQRNAIEEKDKTIEEKDKMVSKQAQEIAELKRLLNIN
jgi:hypothetical protein